MIFTAFTRPTADAPLPADPFFAVAASEPWQPVANAQEPEVWPVSRGLRVEGLARTHVAEGPREAGRRRDRDRLAARPCERLA
jgi:hypothetical protein